MSKDDVRRYIEYEAPGMGMVENEVSEVVCFRDECRGRIEVDPATLVVEDDEAVDVESGFVGEPNRTRLEIYCSPECRNKRYSQTETEQ